MVDLKADVLTIHNQQVPLQRPKIVASREVCCRVTLGDNVDVPPMSETVAIGRILDRPNDMKWGVVESNSTCNTSLDGLLVGRTLVNPSANEVPVHLLNLSNLPKRIRQGTNVAICNSVDSILTEGAVIPRPTELPHHLRDLYIRSANGLTSAEADQLYDLLFEFSDVFSEGSHDLGRTDFVQHQINTGVAAPIRQAPRRLPLARREEAASAVQEMYQQGVIEPSASPWSSPVVLVKKKDGGVRFCVDYRKLNEVTHKDSYPLPRIDDSIEALSGAKWFSTLDLKSGYWQVEMDEKDKEKTAFSIGSGLWQFTVMPF